MRCGSVLLREEREINERLDHLSICPFSSGFPALVVQTLDRGIRQIDHYPENSVIHL